MQGVNILNTTEILGNPSWAINLISIGLFIATIGAIFMIITILWMVRINLLIKQQ